MRAPSRIGWQIWGVVAAEAQKLRHDPVELFTRSAQPALWLTLFGEVMAGIRGVAPGGMPYLDYLSAGILAQSALFVSIFYGIATIWERDLGVLQRYLVSPAPRLALVVGKGLSASIRALSQGVIIYALALSLGAKISLDPVHVGGVVVALVIGACLFALLSLVIACLVKTRERFMGIGQLLTMPIFFASNAIYPLSLMPEWMRVVSRVNPLTYQVDILRALMLADGVSEFGYAVDFSVLLAATAFMAWLAARLYPRMGY